MTYDRVAASVPVNAQAAKQMARGVHYENPHVTEQRFDVCPEIKATPGDTLDLTGKVLGRLTVIGLLATPRPDRANKRAQWVVRCACGVYTLRRSKTLKAGTADACQGCARVAAMRSHKWGPGKIHDKAEGQG